MIVSEAASMIRGIDVITKPTPIFLIAEPITKKYHQVLAARR
jgi:hypothetical protein